MKRSLSRRDLLRQFAMTAGCAVLPAGMLAGPARANVGPSMPNPDYFPLGVASADPFSDGFVVWTQAAASGDNAELTLRVFADQQASIVVAERQIVASEELAFTVRVLLTGLKADQHYYYRFYGPNGEASRLGRSRTAPQSDRLSDLRLAVFSCQDYEQGFFTSYRHFLEREKALTPTEQTDFILHVGDFIYETVRGESDKGWPDLDGKQVALTNPDGSARRIGSLPSGGRQGAFGYDAPASLDDYRLLYRTYLADPDLQEARALYPFVQVWDDHETFNDVWQSFDGTTGHQELRMAANQAWFEFVPAALSRQENSDTHHTHEFEYARVFDAPPSEFDNSFLNLEQGNLAAIGSLTIYRSVRWGQLADLFLVDGRSYRSPKIELQPMTDKRREEGKPLTIPPELLRKADQGSSGPQTLKYGGSEFDNPRADYPQGTMLGQTQRLWLEEELKASKARWKLLGLNVGMLRYGFDDSFTDFGNKNGIYWLDGWDGYPSERSEITTFITKHGIDGVLSLTGDRHMHAAGQLYDDYDVTEPKPVGLELVGASISAPSRLALMATVIGRGSPEYMPKIACDGTKLPLHKKYGPAMDAWLLYGHSSAAAVSDELDQSQVMARKDPEVNPHLNYSDTSAFGYFTVHIRPSSATARFITLPEPLSPNLFEVRREVHLEIEHGDAANPPRITGTKVLGEALTAPIKT